MAQLNFDKNNEISRTHLPTPQNHISAINLSPFPALRIAIAPQCEFPKQLIILRLVFLGVAVRDRFADTDCRGDGGDGEEAEDHDWGI